MNEFRKLSLAGKMEEGIYVSNFKLQPGDILVTVNNRKDLFSRIKRWATGPYEHVYLSMGQVGLLVNRRQRRILRFSMLFESYGRGCALRSLSERYGENVVVMRLKSEFDRRRIPRVLEEAIKLASDESARYDYWCIVSFILPRLICEKLGLPVPLSWQRNPWHVCSEALFEVFYRANLVDILPPGIVPLPGDFVADSSLLTEAHRGELSSEWVE